MEAHIKEALKQWQGRITDDSVFFNPDIPEKKLNNALKKYAPGVSGDQVLVLVDNTVFGSAKDGCLFTKDAFYAHDIASSNIKVPLVAQTEAGYKGKSLQLNGNHFCSIDVPDKGSIPRIAEVMKEIISWHGGAPLETASAAPAAQADFPKFCTSCGAPTKAPIRHCEYCGNRW